MCRIIKWLRVHGLIEKAVQSCKYHVTAFVRRVIARCLTLEELVVISQHTVQGYLWVLKKSQKNTDV